MARKSIDESILNDIGDAIRNKNGEEELYSPEQMSIKIRQIPTGGESMQYDEMPTASEEYLGKIVQYTGATDTNYTQGYFYICRVVGGSSYVWRNILVQENPTSLGSIFSENIEESTYTFSKSNGAGLYVLTNISADEATVTIEGASSDYGTFVVEDTGVLFVTVDYLEVDPDYGVTKLKIRVENSKGSSVELYYEWDSTNEELIFSYVNQNGINIYPSTVIPYNNLANVTDTNSLNLNNNIGSVIYNHILDNVEIKTDVYVAKPFAIGISGIYNNYQTTLCYFYPIENTKGSGRQIKWAFIKTGIYTMNTIYYMNLSLNADGSVRGLDLFRTRTITTTSTETYTPTANTHPATKGYVDSSLANLSLPVTEIDMNGSDIDFGTNDGSGTYDINHFLYPNGAYIVKNTGSQADLYCGNSIRPVVQGGKVFVFVTTQNQFTRVCYAMADDGVYVTSCNQYGSGVGSVDVLMTTNQYTNYSGYDSTATQTLKQVNGVMTWVTD